MENKTLNEQELENVSGGGIASGKKRCTYTCKNGHVFCIDYDNAFMINPSAPCPTCGAPAALKYTDNLID